jgi:glycosyltransferase involved in cell wall biosynthesis
MSEARVLHVLPHRGGGGETYVRYLEAIEGYRFDRLALTRHGHPLETPAGLIRLARAVSDYELLHIHGDSAALVSLPVISRRPTVITLNGAHLLRRSEGLRGAAVRAGLRAAFRRSDAVIAVSEAELHSARDLSSGAARLELVHNGVPEPAGVGEDERRAAREGLGLQANTLTALFVAELAERKQPVQFAQAVERARVAHPELVGLLAGDGPLGPEIEARAGEGVRLLGHRESVRELLAAADVFVLPSLWEGLAFAVLEAMAMGVPVIVSDGPGNPDAVGDAGLVFPAGDVAAMTEALERMAGDAGLRESLGRAAAARARERFSLDGMLAGTARVYEEVLSGR